MLKYSENQSQSTHFDESADNRRVKEGAGAFGALDDQAVLFCPAARK